MLGISWYEFLVVLFISFICLKPADFRKIIVAIRDIVNFINSLVKDVTTSVEKSIALDDFKIDDFFVVNKESKETENINKKYHNIKDAEIIEVNEKPKIKENQNISVDKNNEN